MELKRKYGKKIWSGVWQKSVWRKLLFVLSAVVIAFTAASYGISQWYMRKHSSEPLILGATFIPSRAEEFGLDPKETLNALLNELKLKQIRLVSYWKEIEKTPGEYDFSRLDWQFEMANKHGARVSLVVGLRQPRWPECHEPKWISIDPQNKEIWQPRLYAYMRAVVDRYKDNPALQNYELENEFFMEAFGECKDFDRQRLIAEFNMVKQWDRNHPVIVSRSNNWIGLPIGQPTPDQFAVSVYKRVWDADMTRRYIEYPLPPWWYGALAGMQEITTGRTMAIHEFQAEPWLPPGYDITTAPLEEQFKSVDAKRLKDRIRYGQDTGMRNIQLWGAEWWYWLKEKRNDDSVWQVVKQAVVNAEKENQKLNN